MKIKAAAVGVLLTGVVLGSSAVTLGLARGAAWIGQPLELVVPVQMDAAQLASALCAQADVFHGDSKQESGQVKVIAEPGAQPETATLRIVSAALIDEPVVTVYLQAGCGAKTSRRYVLLADYPNQGVTQAPLPAVVSSPSLATLTPSDADAKPTVISNAMKTVAASHAAAPGTVKSKSASPKAAATKVKAKSASSPRPKPVNPTGTEHARLKLDPLENLSKRIATLETASTTAPQDEVVRESQLMLQLQNDIKALADQATKSQASLLALREQLQKAEAERVPAGLVYGLLALVLLCLGAIAVLWNRRADSSSWRADLPATPNASQAPQRRAVPENDEPQVIQQKIQTQTRPTTGPAHLSAVPTPKAPLDVDLDLMELDEVSFQDLMSYDWGQAPPTSSVPPHSKR